ncbi:VOC family protein [Plantibacter flavus]|uniref:VOC family protein n=1 Tax=Plantibacter flavus TaxID=150123 RepID=UPI003F134C91
MEPRVDFVTLATPDLDAARSFYCDGLGWDPLLDVPGEILFFQVGFGQVLALFDARQFAADLSTADATAPAADSGAAPPAAQGVTLSRNVGGPAEVRAVVDAMLTAGGTLVKTPQRAAFGGYHGHVADPNGVLWEIAFNPGWSVADDGTVSLGIVEP